MAAAATGPPAPSPWATVFGVANDEPWKARQESGLHPKWPGKSGITSNPNQYRLDKKIETPYTIDIYVEDYLRGRVHHPGPIQYRYRIDQVQPSRDNAGNIIPLPRPTDDELDQLFTEEKKQIEWLAGSTSWQAVLFNNSPYLSAWTPDLDVDESRWLQVLRKERWYNLNIKVMDTYPTGIGNVDPRINANTTWSVDEPAIWEAMRPYLYVCGKGISPILAVVF